MNSMKRGPLPRQATPLERIEPGDHVVYASHGVGRVTRTGPDRDDQPAVTLEFARGLSVTLPVERARWYLRSPCSESQLVDVQRTLQASPSGDDDVWRVRMKASKEKLTAGLAVELAEVIRDGAKRVPRLDSRGGLKELSLAERQLYLRARELLADEIAATRGIEAASADEWITAQLA